MAPGAAEREGGSPEGAVHPHWALPCLRGQQQSWIRLMLLSGFPRAPQGGLLNVQPWEPRAPEGSEEELSWQNLLFYPWILLF